MTELLNTKNFGFFLFCFKLASSAQATDMDFTKISIATRNTANTVGNIFYASSNRQHSRFSGHGSTV